MHTRVGFLMLSIVLLVCAVPLRTLTSPCDTIVEPRDSTEIDSSSRLILQKDLPHIGFVHGPAEIVGGSTSAKHDERRKNGNEKPSHDRKDTN